MASFWSRAVGPVTSLRGRLASVALLSAAPLFILLLGGALVDRRQTLAAAHNQVLELARLGAQQQDELILGAANLVRTVGRIPDVRAMAAGSCHEILHQIDDDQPTINGLSVARPDGVIVCNSRSEAPDWSVADRPYFQTAMQPGSPPYVVSEMLISRATGKPMVAIAAPFAEADGPVQGVIIAAVGLEWFGRLSQHGLGAPKQIVEVWDTRDGMLIARSPPDPAIQGHRNPRHPVLAAYRVARGEGTIEALDEDRITRVFGFAPLIGGQSGLVLAVGLEKTAVLIQADTALRRRVVFALAAMLGAVLIAMAFARWSLLRPIEALAVAVGRLGGGDLSTRARVSTGGARELRTLCAAFDAMVDRLIDRDNRLAGMQARLAESEAHHRMLAEVASDMITRLGPDFRRTYVSPACRELLGREPEELVGESPSGIVHPDDWPLLEATLNRPLQRGERAACGTYRALRKDGQTVWLESRGRPLPGGDGFVVVTRDVSERVELEEQLREANQQLEAIAMRDGLTGLANRRGFDAAFASELRRAQRIGAPLALAVVDVDYFKRFNDTYGHQAGDVCLQAIAKAVEGALRRPADLAARWGGEEFVALLPNTIAAGGQLMAERIRAAVDALDLPHTGGIGGRITVSVGVAAFETVSAADGPALLAAADAALYAAKAAGRAMVRLAPQIDAFT